jgi:hypothetical protein
MPGSITGCDQSRWVTSSLFGHKSCHPQVPVRYNGYVYVYKYPQKSWEHVYLPSLLSAIATVPATDNVLAGRAATSSGDAVYRLPNGQVITSKNTLQSHSTAATGSNSSNRRSDSDHGDEGESHHVRGVPVPSTPLSATASPILVSVVHVTQDHAGTASSSPPILAAVVADTNEPIDHGTATGGDNDDASKSRVKKFRIFAVVVFAILLIAVSLFATFYWIKAGKYQATSFRKFTAPLPVQCRS